MRMISRITNIRVDAALLCCWVACAGLCLMLACGRDRETVAPEAWSKKLMVAIDGQMTPERRAAFKAEFAVATAQYDYSQLDPAEVVQDRNLYQTRPEGVYFHRYIVDGQEVDPAYHEPLRTGRRTGRRWRIPAYEDPLDRFVVTRQIYKIENKWEVVEEYWIILPVAPDKRHALKTMSQIGEYAGAEDMLGNSSAGRRVMVRLPGFKSRIVPARGAASRPANKPDNPAAQQGAGKPAQQRAMVEDTGASPAGKSASHGQKSGLSILPRSGMKARTVIDAHGNQVKVWGQSRSPSKTPGHDAAMEARALQMARSGKYEYVTIQRSWRTATGRVGKSRRIPDVIGVRRDGKIDAIEIRSKTDSPQVLEKRLEEGMGTLPPTRRGETAVFDP